MQNILEGYIGLNFFLSKKKYLCSTASIETGFSVLIAITLLIRSEMIVRIT